MNPALYRGCLRHKGALRRRVRIMKGNSLEFWSYSYQLTALIDTVLGKRCVRKLRRKGRAHFYF